jgi:hypothetical protein
MSTEYASCTNTLLVRRACASRFAHISAFGCRLRDARFTHISAASIGFGEARCIIFAHEHAKLDESAELTDAEAATAKALYQDLHSAGDGMSLDEVKTRLKAGELTGMSPSIGCIAQLACLKTLHASRLLCSSRLSLASS